MHTHKVGDRQIGEAAVKEALATRGITEQLEKYIRYLLRNIVQFMKDVLQDCIDNPDTRVYQIENGSIEACFCCLDMMMDFQLNDIVSRELQDPFKNDLFEKLCEKCQQVEEQVRQRGKTKEPSKVPIYFKELNIKYIKRLQELVSKLKGKLENSMFQDVSEWQEAGMDSSISEDTPPLKKTKSMNDAHETHEKGPFDVFRMLLPMAGNWQNIATLLGLTAGQRQTIERNNPTVQDRLRVMIDLWLQQTDPPSIWDALANTVETLDNKRLAEEIREKYVCSTENQPD